MSKVNWNLDPTHSEIGFKVKHLMITNVSGSFEKFDVKAETEGEDFGTAKLEFTADVNSVNTGNEQRDAHLKSADFFDGEHNSQLRFVSNGVDKKSDDEYTIKGDLTIRGVTKPVQFNAEFGGIQKDPWGNEKAGFSLNGKLNRSDFNLNWNAALEAGGVLVSDEVRFNAEIQVVKGA